MFECPVCKEMVDTNEVCPVCGFSGLSQSAYESDLDYLKRAYLYKRHHKDKIKVKKASKQIVRQVGDPMFKDIYDLTNLSNETVKAYLRNSFDLLYNKYEIRRKELLSREYKPSLHSFFGYDRHYPLRTLCSDQVSYYYTNNAKTEGFYYGVNGAVYKGGLSNWKFHGKGELIYDNKDCFAGMFSHGSREGVGELVLSSNKSYQHGLFSNNNIVDYVFVVFESKAIALRESSTKEKVSYEEIRYNEGSIFVGKRLNFLRHGKGIYITNLGDHFFGSFKDGLQEGFGRYYYSDKNVYIGDFVKGERHGKGTFIWPDGQYYHGEFVKDYRQGYGEYYYPNGAYYKGQWHQGKRHGQGEYHYSDGSIYVGDWKENKRHGEGEYTKENGEILSGIWENDEFKGQV